MELWMLVVFVPIAVAWSARLLFPKQITRKEMGASLILGVLITSIVYAGGLWSETSDREVRNGEVQSKSRDKVSCSHSYSCHCRTDSKGNQSCDTCYEHSYDIDWNVNTNIGQFSIDRIDRQGLVTPSRWQSVQVGDPVSDTFSFTNYVKAVPDSLYHATDVGNFDKLIPPYPNKVYDYYNVDHVLTAGVNVPDLKQWNQETALLLRKLGPQRQANVIIVFVNTSDSNYIHALEGKWIGGKKNDIIVVIGTTQFPNIDFVAVSSWTDSQIFKVQLRDDIYALKVVDRTKVLAAIDSNVMATYKRKEMKDFEYLKSQIQPPMWVLILAVILGIVMSAGVSYCGYRHDLFS